MDKYWQTEQTHSQQHELSSNSLVEFAKDVWSEAAKPFENIASGQGTMKDYGLAAIEIAGIACTAAPLAAAAGAISVGTAFEVSATAFSAGVGGFAVAEIGLLTQK